MSDEQYGPYIVRCPGCRKMIDSVPAENVPDQGLRGCPGCLEVFWLSEIGYFNDDHDEEFNERVYDRWLKR